MIMNNHNKESTTDMISFISKAQWDEKNDITSNFIINSIKKSETTLKMNCSEVDLFKYPHELEEKDFKIIDDDPEELNKEVILIIIVIFQENK